MKWRKGKAIFGRVVRATNEAFDSLTTTTFWLSVGRQLEPHQFNFIFPLPNNSDIVETGTAEGLFNVSCEFGSLSTALSALPLFSSHIESQKRVVQLLYHCLNIIKQTFSEVTSLSSASQVFAKELKFIHQLFWFGVKLEDAIKSMYDRQDSELSYDESIASSSTEASMESSSASSYSDDISSVDSLEDPATDVLSTPQRALHVNSSKAGIISKVVTNLFQSKTQADGGADEDAIHDAASSFIISGFDSPVKSRLTTPLPIRRDIARSMSIQEQDSAARKLSLEENDSIEDNNIPYTSLSVAGAVVAFISDVIGLNREQHPPISNLNAGWQTVSVVAHILQGDRETSAITSAASHNALEISRVSTVNVAKSGSFNGKDEKTDLEIIVRFFRSLISDCAVQIQPEAAGVIFNLILLLLLRFDVCEDVNSSKTTLIIVGIVSGHVSGRISELVDFSSANPIQNMYSSLLQSLQDK